MAPEDASLKQRQALVKALVIGSAAALLGLGAIATAMVMVQVPTAPPTTGRRMQIDLMTPKPTVLPRGAKLETMPSDSGPIISTAPATAPRPPPAPVEADGTAPTGDPFDHAAARSDPDADEEAALDRRAQAEDRRDARDDRERRNYERAYERAERDAEAQADRFRQRPDLPDLPPPRWPRYERPED